MINTVKYAKNQFAKQTYFAFIFVLLVAFTSMRPIINSFHHHFFLESDSVAYLGLGINLLSGKGFVTVAGDWCSDWPPLYPFALGLSRLFTHDSVLAIGIVGGLCFGTTMLFSYLWLGKLTKSITIRFVAAVVMAFSAPMTHLANSGFSETLFVPLSIASLYFTACSLDSGSRKSLLAAACAAVLCCLARYIGAVVIAAGFFAILTSSRNPGNKKLFDSILYITVSTIPVLLWCGVNKALTGAWMGNRILGSHTLIQCIRALFASIQAAFVNNYLSIILASASLLGLAAMVKNQKHSNLAFLSIGAYFILFYTALLLWSSSTYSIDMIDDRLTYPLFVPLIAVSIGLIECLRTALNKAGARCVTALTAAFFVMVTVYALQVPQVPEGGYLSSEWQNSSTLAYVRSKTFTDPLFTNDSSATYLFGHKGAECIADATDSPTMPYVEGVITGIPSQSYVIWLYNGLEPDNFNAAVLKSKCDIRIVAKFDDGVIFQRKGSPQQTASSM